MRDSTSNLPLGSVVHSEGESVPSLVTRTSSLLSSCRICLSSIFEPAALTCGHRFCERCLEQYWTVKDKPVFLICPLCRAYAYDVDFAKKEEIPPEADFRKMFSTIEELNPETEISESVIWCLKISVIMPILFCIVKWLKEPAAKLLSYTHLSLLADK